MAKVKQMVGQMIMGARPGGIAATNACVPASIARPVINQNAPCVVAVWVMLPSWVTARATVAATTIASTYIVTCRREVQSARILVRHRHCFPLAPTALGRVSNT